MALNTITLTVNVQAPGVEATINKVVTGVDRIADSAGKMASVRGEMAKLTSAFAGLFAVRIAGDAIVGLIAKADAMTQAFNKVKIASDLDTAAQERLNAAIIKASGATRFSYEQSADAAKNLLQAGLDVGSTISALTPVLGLAQIGETGTEEMAKLVAMLGRFGISGENIGLAFDKMFKATKISTLDAKELVQILAKAGPGALAAGVGFDQMLASLALLRSGMANASTAGTLFGRAMRTFIDPKALQKLSDTFGVVTIQGGKLRDPLTLMNELAQKIGSNAAKAGELGRIMGVQGSASVLSLTKAFTEGLPTADGQILKSTELVKYFNDQIKQTAGGEGAAALAISMQSVGAQFDVMKNAFGTFIGVVLKDFGSNLSAVIGKIGGIVTAFNSALGASGALRFVFGHLVSTALTFGGIAVTLLSIASGFRIATAAAGLLRASIMGIGPVGAVLGGISRGLLLMAGQMIAAGGASRFLGIGLRGLTAALGPIGIILTALSLIPLAVEGITALFGLGGSKEAEDKKKAAEAAALEVGAVAQEKSANAVDAAAEALKAQVTKFEKTLDAPFPFFDPKILNTALKIKDAVGATFGPEAAGKLGPHLQVLGEAFKELRTQGGLTEATMKKVAGEGGALQVLKAAGGLLESTGKLPKDTAKQMQTMMDALEKSVSPEAVKTRALLGSIAPQFATREQKAAIEAQTRASAEEDKAFLRSTTIGGLGPEGAPTVFGAAKQQLGPRLTAKLGEPFLARRAEREVALAGARESLETVVDRIVRPIIQAQQKPLTFAGPAIIEIGGERIMGVIRSANATDDGNRGNPAP